MISGGHIIKTAMENRGFKHSRGEDSLSIRGEYARNIQYVYSKETRTRDGMVIDLLYFGVDILDEKLVIGLYRENPNVENGVYINASRAMSLTKFTREELERELDRLVTPIREHLK